ncbi:hypothetical protein [Microbacterium hominis]|uniref:Uncharacterized protein n=1 Tax=Microbacterium hominis TaxID=162426 RepID=A0A7D4TMR9_9MICO|nr:hypothetical protein [Microbacterium hominis]QKJ19222.1 hypothetical protein HQM25_07465 [Microbacterium hominis]
MSHIGTGVRRPAGTIAIITTLAVLGLGLAGCQTTTAASQEAERSGPVSAAQIERTAKAAQERYEGLAEYYAKRAQNGVAADGGQPVSAQVADRLENAASTGGQPVSAMTADRLDRIR